jgi:hypothetical protein
MYIQWEVLYICKIVFLIVYYRANAFGGAELSFRSTAPVVPNQVAGFPMMKGTVTSTEPAIRVRRNFPETWLWQMLETGYAVCCASIIIVLCL